MENSMQALLLIAHGSRREASNQEVRELAKRLEQMIEGQFDLVEPAFLELAEPDIRSGIGRCVQAGARHVTAVPYLLSAGRHVAKDIPDELEVARLLYPDIRIVQTDYLGMHQGIAGLILELATKP